MKESEKGREGGREGGKDGRKANLGWAALELVEQPAFEKLLVGYPDLDGGRGSAMLLEPGVDEGHVLREGRRGWM